MARCRKGAKRVKLSDEEIKTAALRMMAAADASRHVAQQCRRHPTEPDSVEDIYFTVVPFSLTLLSIEQSLRLALLLHHSVVRDDTNHNPGILYRDLRGRSGTEAGIIPDIISKLNEVGQDNNLDPFSEKELKACLQKHDASYSLARYFELDHQAKLSKKGLRFTPREEQILYCAAWALVLVNTDEMKRRGIGTLQEAPLLTIYREYTQNPA